MTDFSAPPPTSINPYKVLDLPPTASLSDIKSAYRKLALKHHPDKAPTDAKDTAHTAFQALAFAYAILSDSTRRRRYDATGSTSESLLDDEDGDFNWSDFFRAQWAETVTGEKLNNFKTTYQGSVEERNDVLKAYEQGKGKMNKVFASVMLSNPLDDEERFRGYLDQAIAQGDIEALDAYTKETKRTRDERHRKARKEAKEAEEHAKDTGIHESMFGNGDGKTKKAGKKDDVSALADLIQQRNKSRASNFLDNLEAKYVSGKKDTAKGKKRGREDEPSEEAFQRTAERVKKRKAAEIGDEPEPATKTTKTKPKARKGKKAPNAKDPTPRNPITRGKKPKAPIVEDEDEDDDDMEIDLAEESAGSEEPEEPEEPEEEPEEESEDERPKEKSSKSKRAKRTKR